MRPSKFSGLTPGSGHSEPLATQAKKLCLLRFSLGPNIQQARKPGFSYEVNLSWKSVSSRDSGSPLGIQKEESLLCWSIEEMAVSAGGSRGVIFGGDGILLLFFEGGRRRGGGEEWSVFFTSLLCCYAPFDKSNCLTLLVIVASSNGYVMFPNCCNLKQLLKLPFEVPYSNL